MNLTKGARSGVTISTSKAWRSSPLAANDGGMDQMAHQRGAEPAALGARR
jgi:hypothetical protein